MAKKRSKEDLTIDEHESTSEDASNEANQVHENEKALDENVSVEKGEPVESVQSQASKPMESGTIKVDSNHNKFSKFKKS